MDEFSKIEEKYRPRSMRHPTWNYADTAWYEVTICTKESRPSFGKVHPNGKMHLSSVGRIVEREWLKTADLRSSILLDEFCIMPDHFHGIIALYDTRKTATYPLAKKDRWQKNSLGSVINQFKGVCTKHIRKIAPEFAWQRNFHDHIIRNEKDLERIRKYIRSNPEAHVFRKEDWRSYDG